MLMINPGSRIGTEQDGWTNTYEGAEAEAKKWLRRMRDDGMVDVKLVGRDRTEREGRWTFTFRHGVTGVDVELETHGIDDLEAYKRQHCFHPRVYWNGSSTGDPCIEDFARRGFRKLVTYVPSR